MRSEVVSCWISDVSDACHNVPDNELDVFVWKTDVNQQNQADSALASLVWCHRPQRKTQPQSRSQSQLQVHHQSASGLGTSPPLYTSDSSPLRFRRHGTPSSDSPPRHEYPQYGQGTSVTYGNFTASSAAAAAAGTVGGTSASIRITPSPDPDTFPEPDDYGPFTTRTSTIAPPVGLQRGRSLRALRQKSSQASMRLGRSQSAALSSLRKEFISHDELRRRGSPSPVADVDDAHAGLKPRPIPSRLFASSSRQSNYDDAGSTRTGTMGSHIVAPGMQSKTSHSHLHISNPMDTSSSVLGNARSMGALLNLDDDDDEDDQDNHNDQDLDRYKYRDYDDHDDHEPPVRSVVDSEECASSLYNRHNHHHHQNATQNSYRPAAAADDRSHSHRAASSEVLGPSKQMNRLPVSMDALMPGQPTRSHTHTTHTTTNPNPNTHSPTPEPGYASVYRALPLRTVLETLEKPLRWDDTGHDVRHRARNLAATHPQHHALADLVRAISATSRDFHTCKLPQEVSPLFDDDEDVPPDAFASDPFDAIDALPGMEQALAAHVGHDQYQYAHSVVSLQTAAAMAVLQHAQIADIVQATNRCRDNDASSHSWGDSVYMPLLRLAIAQTKGIHAENVVGATMLSTLAPKSLPKALPKPPRPDDPPLPISLMMDYALVLSPAQLDSATGNQLHRELLGLIRRRRATVDECSFNHSLYGPLCKAPIAAFIRTEAPGTTFPGGGGGGSGSGHAAGAAAAAAAAGAGTPAAAALSQLGLSLTSWYRHVSGFCECTFQTPVCAGPPMMPLLRVAGDSWAVTFVVNGEEEYEVLPTINIGSSDTVTGAYRLLEALRLIVQWISTEYLEWLTEFVGQHS